MSDSAADTALISHEPSRGGGAVAWLIVALIACVVLRVWLIDHAEIIEPDGVVYVEAAKQWRADPATMVDLFDIHPGFPMLICAGDRVLGAFGQKPGPLRWELAGRCVALMASLATTVALLALATMMFDHRIAWITVLLVSMTRKWAILGAAVLTDAPMACLVLWAIVLSIHVGRGLAGKRHWAIPAAALVGLLAAGGFLIRPEAMLALPTAAILWMAHALRRRCRWSTALAACAAAAVVMAVCISPYVARIGTLTKRWPLPEWLGGGQPRVLAMSLAVWGQALWQIFPKFSERMHPLLTVNLGFWVLTWIVHRTRTSLPQAILLMPRWDAMLAALVWCALFMPLLVVRNAELSEMSSRYVVIHAMLLAPLAGAGAVIVGEWAAVLISHLRANYTLTRRITVPVVVVIYAFFLAEHAARPLHSGDAPIRAAGLYLLDHAQPDDFVFARTRQMLTYSQTQGAALMNDAMSSREAMLSALTANAQAAKARAVYLALPGEDVHKYEHSLAGEAFKPVELFSDPDPNNTVHLYRVNLSAIDSAASQTAPASAP